MVAVKPGSVYFSLVRKSPSGAYQYLGIVAIIKMGESGFECLHNGQLVLGPAAAQKRSKLPAPLAPVASFAALQHGHYKNAFGSLSFKMLSSSTLAS